VASGAHPVGRTPDLDQLVREVYPLVANRHWNAKHFLMLAHMRLTLFGGEEWADMALRVMLEYSRGE
jgi:hypothetical protein